MNGLVSGYGSDSDDEDANNTEESKSTGMKSVKKLYLVNFWKRFFFALRKLFDYFLPSCYFTHFFHFMTVLTVFYQNLIA